MAWPKDYEQMGCASERTHLPRPAFEFVLKNCRQLSPSLNERHGVPNSRWPWALSPVLTVPQDCEGTIQARYNFPRLNLNPLTVLDQLIGILGIASASVNQSRRVPASLSCGWCALMIALSDDSRARSRLGATMMSPEINRARNAFSTSRVRRVNTTT